VKRRRTNPTTAIQQTLARFIDEGKRSIEAAKAHDNAHHLQLVQGNEEIARGQQSIATAINHLAESVSKLVDD